MSGQRVALLITTGVFQDPGLRLLRSPAQDAKGMADVLGDPVIGGFDVMIVDGKAHHEVKSAVGTFLDGRSSDDVVVVYVSTHGLLDMRGRLHFAGVDTTKAGVWFIGVAWEWLLDALEECRARRQVVILDCCHSGAVNRAKGDGDITSALSLGTAKGRVILTASRAAEYSHEGELIDGTVVAASVYTAGLIEGLRSGDADTNGDGMISVAEAHEYAVKHVAAVGAKQKPTWNVQRAEGNIILAHNPKGPTVTPAPRPEELHLRLELRYPNVRKAAVEELGGWLRGDDPGRALAARTELTRIADGGDIPAIGGRARELLGELMSTATPAVDNGPSRILSFPPAAPGRRCNSASLRTIRASPNTYGGINGVAFSSDGTLLATGSDDKTVRLWT